METAARRKIDSQTNRPSHSTAYYFLEGLTELGIEYLFCNFGTDHAPIIEEIAHRRKRGDALPTIIRCPHENTAAHMAAGYAFVTGRGQGVLVHVDVGTANTATAMHNIFRSRLPALLMAGKAPFTTSGELVGSRDTYVHFVQEPFDQASLVRPYLKWEWTLPSGVVVKEALRRAHSIMQSEPQGPVYLMMQRETLTQNWYADEIRRYGAELYGRSAPAMADAALIAELAQRLIAAEHPILITGYAGRSARAAELITELAEFAGIAVFESNMTNNISHDSPCFVGFQPGIRVNDCITVPRSEKQDSLVCLTGHMGQGYLEGGVAQMLFARDYGKGIGIKYDFLLRATDSTGASGSNVVTCKKKPPKYFELSKLGAGPRKETVAFDAAWADAEILKTACGKGFPRPKEVFGTLAKGDAYVPLGFEKKGRIIIDLATRKVLPLR